MPFQPDSCPFNLIHAISTRIRAISTLIHAISTLIRAISTLFQHQENRAELHEAHSRVGELRQEVEPADKAELPYMDI